MLIHHVCIQTNSYQDSLDFYTRVLGFEIIKVTKGFHGRSFLTWLKKEHFMIELQTSKEGQELRDWSSLNSGPVHLGFLVNSVKDSYDSIKAKGHHSFKLKNGQEIYQVEGETLCKVKAPEGTEIELRETDIY